MRRVYISCTVYTYHALCIHIMHCVYIHIMTYIDVRVTVSHYGIIIYDTGGAGASTLALSGSIPVPFTRSGWALSALLHKAARGTAAKTKMRGWVLRLPFTEQVPRKVGHRIQIEIGVLLDRQRFLSTKILVWQGWCAVAMGLRHALLQ